MRFQRHIFREYDVRGVAGVELDADLAEALGRAYASELRESESRRGRSSANRPRVVVGEDNRPSSPELCAALIRGLRRSGCDAVYLGTAPTPVAYFAEREWDARGAVQITGSHNPPEYNGVKMTVAGRSIHGAAIRRLAARIRADDFLDGDGTLETVDPLPRYVRDVAGRFAPSRPVRAVVDCGNGTGSVVAVELLRAAGLDVVPLHCESDGTFPNHHPDPTVDENVQDMIRAVLRSGAEVGIGFDGDADRIGVVDDRGRVVRGDVLLLLFGLDVLRRLGPGRTLVFDVKCSQVLPEEFARAGGSPLMWKTGHSLIKEKMQEVGAPIAGELSGHICFADGYYGFDDALYAACRLAELLASRDRSLSEIVDALPSYVSTPEMRLEVPEETKFGLVERAVAHFRARHDVVDVDGARVLFPDGWGLIRASNTQPVVSVRCEAKTRAQLDRIRGIVEGWLRAQGVATE